MSNKRRQVKYQTVPPFTPLTAILTVVIGLGIAIGVPLLQHLGVLS